MNKFDSQKWERICDTNPSDDHSVDRRASCYKAVSLLVIGCGNTFRGDDGAGYVIAEAVEQWGLENVRALPVHQLAPELAEELAAANEAVFVDAMVSTQTPGGSDLASDLAITEIGGINSSLPSTSPIGHSMKPDEILAFTRLVYGRAPRTWVLGVPAYSFDAPDVMSGATRQSMDSAISWIRNRILEQAKESVPCTN
jgi:hydrogenase maturation protease